MAIADTSNIIAAWPVEGASGSIDDAYRYLTRAVRLRDDFAVSELNQKFVQGDLQLHYRRTDAAGIGQEGVVPPRSWSLGQLYVDVDRNPDAERPPIDWAIGKATAANDGRAFVRLLKGQEGSGQTYKLAISMAEVRRLWPTSNKRPPMKKLLADVIAAMPLPEDRSQGEKVKWATDALNWINAKYPEDPLVLNTVLNELTKSRLWRNKS
jgi:hypothetical protein